MEILPVFVATGFINKKVIKTLSLSPFLYNKIKASVCNMFLVKSEGWIDMDHKQFQEWLSGTDHLSPTQRPQTEAVFPGDTETAASLAAIEAAVGGRSPVPALWHARSHIAWQGKGSATVPVQGMQEDIQCRDRHPLVGSAPQGQVAFLRSLSCRWADGSRFSRTLRTCRQHRLPLAAPNSLPRKT